MITLSAEKGSIFRITHIDNVPWTLRNGLHCRTSGVCDPLYHEIGNPDLIDKRRQRVVPIAPGGTLSDYIPFYFTPYSPMLLNIKTGYNGLKQTPMPEIVILVASLHDLDSGGIRFVMSDRHAYLQTAKFTNTVTGLGGIDWALLRDRDFKRDPNDPSKVERYQAEALVHTHLPIKGVKAILCHGEEQQERLQELVEGTGLSTPVLHRRDCYF